VQFYTGGTVTYSNGYIVHNFTANGTLAPTTPTVVSEYQISRSLRFNIADSAYLNRTPATTTNRTTWTWSGWVKRASFGSSQVLFGAGPDASNYTIFYFSGTVSENLEIYNYTGAVTTGYAYTTSVFRDPSAWYHVVLAVDTNQATSADRTKIYVNGVLQPITISTTFASSVNTWVNTNNSHRLGSTPTTSALYGGYMTEINFVDGQQLTPTSFGYVNPTTGIWSPAKFVGGYGTNGFYLNFSDNSNTTAATLGADYSGNGNNWTPNNFSVTAGIGNDSFVDSPTSYGTDAGVGGEVRGNYATLNPVAVSSTYISVLNGNLQQGTVSSGATYQEIPITLAVNFSGSNKWYAEVNTTTVSGTYYPSIAISSVDKLFAAQNIQGGATSNSTAYMANGQKYNNGSLTSYGSAFTNGDVVGIAVDEAAGTVVMYKNNVSQGTLASSLTGLQYITVTAHTGSNFYFNAGQRPFAYTAPSGFKALCTQNLPTPTIGATSATLAGKFFAPVLYTGNGGTQSVTGVGFQPDWTWIKRRDGVTDHQISDAVRGAGYSLHSNTTGAEDNFTTYFTSFTSDGFNLAGGTLGYNVTSGTFVAWNWKANGSGSSNTAGSITSTVSASTTSGFSVVTYTGNATSNQTFGHGLGAKVDFAIIKSRSAVSSPAWMVWHRSVCSGNGKALALEETNAIQGPFGTPIWDSSNTSTQASSTTFTIGANTTINASGATYVAYCFAEVAGYSAFGSYTGNGSTDGPFVYTGMRPAYLMIKRTDSSPYNWVIVDTARNTYNVANAQLSANLSNAENTSFAAIDFNSNGFKMRTTDGAYNSSGGTYIYMAFASNPFKYSLAR